MDEKKLALLGILSVFLIVLMVVFFQRSGKEEIKPSSSPPPPELEPSSRRQEKTKIITLFFLSEEDSFLHPEKREIASDSSVVRQARQTIMELIKGSQNGYLSPFPPETKLRELYLTDEGVAHVDFSKDILEKPLFGSSSEIAAIYSTVNSLTYNFKLIKKVFILIEGQEKETLGGHINLSRSFLPYYGLIAH